jgi:UDP:flavonoid glycosyltransferase YjiC (YdhE family)
MPGERADDGTASPVSSPTILIMVWPEYGHIVTLLALAKQLRERRYRVVFAGVRTFEQPMRALGYEYANLSAARPGAEPTLFDYLPHRAAFQSAVTHFINSSRAALSRYSPDLILFDSLYSAFGTLAAAAGVPWALYETDLPREQDPNVPPPHLQLPPSAENLPRIREEWASQLRETAAIRAGARSAPDMAFAWASWHFPTLLTEELQGRLGTSVPYNYDVLYVPVARVPRMVFCPPEFDFARADAADISWVGPCIDHERSEPDFPWQGLPLDRRIAYCSLGTQTHRHARTTEVLQRVVDVFSAREDYFLVLACNSYQRQALRCSSPHVLLVERAPQLALLRRASLALTHAGFNSIKECAALGVRMIALPLGLDQPRNAALIEHRGLGKALDVEQMTPALLDAAVTEVTCSTSITGACARMKDCFERWQRQPHALDFVERLLKGRSEHTRAA